MSYRNRDDSTQLITYLTLAIVDSHDKFSKILADAAGDNWQQLPDRELISCLAKHVGQERTHADHVAFMESELEFKRQQKKEHGS